jgi:TatA/E family protein of Tat protein translocase
MFGSLGVPELLLIFFVILIVFGPRRIPEIGRTLGKALGEFKKATDDLKNTIEREVRLEELKQVAPTIVAPFESISRSDLLGLAMGEPVPAAETAALPAVESTATESPSLQVAESPSDPTTPASERSLDDSDPVPSEPAKVEEPTV